MTTKEAKSDLTRARDLLTRYLALRDHSRFELQEKLSGKFPREVVDQVLAEADASGWLTSDDVIAARSALAWQRQLKSPAYIEAQLRKRHLPVPPRDRDADLETARALFEKKFGPAPELSYDEKGKAYRFMKYRGFEDRLIRMVLNGQEN